MNAYDWIENELNFLLPMDISFQFVDMEGYEICDEDDKTVVKMGHDLILEAFSYETVKDVLFNLILKDELGIDVMARFKNKQPGVLS